jgi:hypothetical protein
MFSNDNSFTSMIFELASNLYRIEKNCFYRVWFHNNSYSRIYWSIVWILFSECKSHLSITIKLNSKLCKFQLIRSLDRQIIIWLSYRHHCTNDLGLLFYKMFAQLFRQLLIKNDYLEIIHKHSKYTFNHDCYIVLIRWKRMSPMI